MTGIVRSGGRRSGAAVLVMALLGMVAGCGDDGGSATAGSSVPPTTAPTVPSAEPATGASATAPMTDTAPTTADPGGSTPATTGPGTGSAAVTRTVRTEMGPIEIPAQPERIVALDEYAAMNLLALGVEPMEVWGMYQSDISQRILADTGVSVTESSWEAGLNFEAIAAARPDLIVFTAEVAFTQHHEQLSDIAPTVVLPYSKPWRETITTTARIFDRVAEGEHLVEVLEARLDEVADLAPADPEVLSILGDTAGMLFAVSNVTPLSSLVADVGFVRPVAQSEGTPDEAYDAAVMISPETLGDHDGDIVAVLAGNYYDAERIISLPPFGNLSAVAGEQVYVVDGDMWVGTFPFAIYWILEDLEALRTGRGEAAIGTTDDVTVRWAEFEELIG